MTKHLRRKRQGLLRLLWELGLPQELTEKNLHLLFVPRRYIQRSCSVQPIDAADLSVENAVFSYPHKLLETTATKAASLAIADTRTFVLLPTYSAPTKFAKFCRCVCRTWEELCAAAGPLEKYSNKLLRLSQTWSNTEGCNIHKSLFMDLILHNSIIRVGYSSFSCRKSSNEPKASFTTTSSPNSVPTSSASSASSSTSKTKSATVE